MQSPCVQRKREKAFFRLLCRRYQKASKSESENFRFSSQSPWTANWAVCRHSSRQQTEIFNYNNRRNMLISTESNDFQAIPRRWRLKMLLLRFIKFSDAEFGERQKTFPSATAAAATPMGANLLTQYNEFVRNEKETYFILMEAKFFFFLASEVRSHRHRRFFFRSAHKKNLTQTVFLSFNLWRNNVKKNAKIKHFVYRYEARRREGNPVVCAKVSCLRCKFLFC